jgi:hypothetical protein
MNEPVRIWLEQLRSVLDADARASKQSQDAVVTLAKAYKDTDEADRGDIDDILVDWLRSSDPATRYDARYLIRLFNVITALPALEELAVRLANTPGASAVYELKRIHEIIYSLQRSIHE